MKAWLTTDTWETSRAPGTPRSGTTQGNLRYEELMGEEGFSSDSSLLYHRGVPSAIVDSHDWELPDLATTPEPPAQAAPPQAPRPAPAAATQSPAAGW